jgi:hypothetical protein
MGKFEPMEPPLAVNGRPVYQAAGGVDRYFFLASDSQWWLGNEASMRAGKAWGWVQSAAAEPDALTPDPVKGGWQVFDHTRPAGVLWLAAPSVCVRQVRREGGCGVGARRAV